MTYDVVIVGGGVAGSAAAIHCARRGRSVLLLEKHAYPTHKLCGEFLSPEAAGMLEATGVWTAVQAAGARPVRALRLTAGGRSFETELPGTAWGLSRYRLDALLFEHARSAGAEARTGVRVGDVAGTLPRGFRVATSAGTVAARVVLGAYGKHNALDRKLGREVRRHRKPYVAFKAHYEGASPGDAIEVHAFPDGYCGLVRVEEGRVNVCWIAYRQALQRAEGRPGRMIEEVLSRNPVLAGRLAALRRVDDTFLAVSPAAFVPKSGFAGDVCMIGDSAGMIAPMCGDGMAMALRSAELAVPLVEAFLAGTLPPDRFRRRYEASWQDEFGPRFRLGRWVHAGFMHPWAARLGLRICRTVPGVARWIIRNTRGE